MNTVVLLPSITDSYFDPFLNKITKDFENDDLIFIYPYSYFEEYGYQSILQPFNFFRNLRKFIRRRLLKNNRLKKIEADIVRYDSVWNECLIFLFGLVFAKFDIGLKNIDTKNYYFVNTAIRFFNIYDISKINRWQLNILNFRIFDLKRQSKNFISNKSIEIDRIILNYLVYMNNVIFVESIKVKENVKILTFAEGQYNIVDIACGSGILHNDVIDYYKGNFNMDIQNIIEKNKTIINNRFKGKIDLAINYERTKKFDMFIDLNSFLKTNKIVHPNFIILFLHDFYDSPHYCGHLGFVDYWNWVQSCLSIFKSYNTNYTLIIKPHPNSDNLDKALSKIKLEVQDNENIIFLEEFINNDFLMNILKPKVILTLTGTIILESILMGIEVICLKNNPVKNFNLNIGFDSELDYLQKLKSVLLNNDNEFICLQNLDEENRAFYIMNYLRPVFPFNISNLL